MHRAASTVCALSGFSPQVLGDFSQNGLHPATAGGLGGGGEMEHSRQSEHPRRVHFSSVTRTVQVSGASSTECTGLRAL